MNKISKIVLTLTAMLAAGCAENVSAPTAAATKDVTIAGGGATAALTTTDTIRFTFVIDPSRTTVYSLGAGNSITFPAGSLCATWSTYGGGQWDKPCSVSPYPVTVYTKAWLDSDGYAHVDFDKHVRFVPTSNPAGWVMLSLADYGAATAPWTKINYCPSAMAQSGCIDESKSDPTVATMKDPVTGKLIRRVKHFSGYSLTSGRDSESF